MRNEIDPREPFDYEEYEAWLARFNESLQKEIFAEDVDSE